MLLLVCSLVGFGVLFSRPGTVGKGRTSPEVITDRSDYEPGSTAHITGSGFRPKETVGLQVLHADGTPDTGEDHARWYVAADPHGELVTSWHVCEIFIGAARFRVRSL